MLQGKRIVVLGGGSGGVAAATELGQKLGRQHEVVLIDRNPFHVYMPALLMLMTGDRTARDITRDLVHVRREVLEATGGKQVPWDNSSLTGEVILKALPKAEPVIVKDDAAQAASSRRLRQSRGGRDRAADPARQPGPEQIDGRPPFVFVVQFVELAGQQVEPDVGRTDRDEPPSRGVAVHDPVFTGLGDQDRARNGPAGMIRCRARSRDRAQCRGPTQAGVSGAR